MYLLNFLLVAVAAVSSVTALPKPQGTQQWDAIVVGAGPAGIIVATRMANAGLQTLLLEAGGPSYGVTGGNLDARRPAWLQGTNLTRVDVPGLYKSIFATNDGLTCSLNSYGGCAIGGGSAINAGLFFQPPASDYDLYFPTGWKSKDMQSATQRLIARQPSTSVTSKNGQLYLQSGYNVAKKWLVDGLGFKNVDINAQANDKKSVFGHPIFDYANGQRGGPAITYLQSVMTKPNFKLQTGTQVIRVERNGNQAIGVSAIVNGVQTFIPLTSTGRVILSSGAIQSPSLLMFSGIGDPAVLTRLKNAGKLSSNMASSQWINATSVGFGLFDNPNTFIELSSPSVQSYTYSYDSPPQGDKDLYLQQRSGPYSFASETSVFWDSLTRPDGSVAGFQGTIDSAGYSGYTSGNTITLNVYGTSGMKSYGSVILNDQFAPGPNNKVYYSDPTDAANIATFIHKIFQGLPAAGLTPLNIKQTASVADIQKYITTPSAYAVGSVNHWSSSCRIGYCVDANTKVAGMQNLHVVDASIVSPLTVNPQFGVMAVAERGAELILALMGKTIVGN